MSIAAGPYQADTGDLVGAWIFVLTNPATGTNAVSVSFSPGTSTDYAVTGISASFTGVNTTTPYNSSHAQNQEGVSSSISLNVSSSTGNIVLDFVADGSGNESSTQTLIKKNDLTTHYGSGCCAMSYAAGASSITMGYSMTGDDYAYMAIDVNAAGGASANWLTESYWWQPLPYGTRG